MMLRRLVVTVGMLVTLAACSQPSTGTPTGPSQAGVQPQPPPPTPTLRPTATPLPVPEALTTEQVGQRLDPFASPDCQLPCYIGLTPGAAGLSEALAFYARLGIGVPDLVPGDFQQALGGTGNLRATLMRSTDIAQALDQGFEPPETNIYLSESKIQFVYVRFKYYPASLGAARILSSLGPPDQVGLAMLFTSDPNIPGSFVLQMIYAARQTGFIFLGSAAGDAAAQQVCLTDAAVRETVIGVFAPGLNPLGDNPSKSRILPLDQSAGISTADFAAATGAGTCLSIPADKWAQWQ